MEKSQVEIEIEIAQRTMRLKHILEAVVQSKLNGMELASLVATIAGRVHEGMVHAYGAQKAEIQFAHWWFTVNKGLLSALHCGLIKTEIRNAPRPKGN